MIKTLIAIATLIIIGAAAATPMQAECKRLTDDPASPCREVDVATIAPPIIAYDVALEGEACVFNAEWTNPPIHAQHYALYGATHSQSIAAEYTAEAYYREQAVFGSHTPAHTFTYAFGLDAAYNPNMTPSGNHRQRVAAVNADAALTPLNAGSHWQVGVYHLQEWRRKTHSIYDAKTFPHTGWTLADFQAALFDCAQELEDKLERADEAARVADEQRAIAIEERERELELNRRLTIQLNDLKLAQERLAVEVKLQEKETRITAEIIALQMRIARTRIATQEAILSGLERRAEIIRTGALERNAIMQEFLLQSGSRYEQIEAKQAAAIAALKEQREAFQEIQRRNEQIEATQEATLYELETQEGELGAEVERLKAQLPTDE